MLATGAAAITAIGGYGAYLGLSRSKDTNAPTPIDDEPEVVGRTWKESAGRTSGRDGYVFGDLSRGVIVRVFGQESADAAAEAQGDAQHSQVQERHAAQLASEREAHTAACRQLHSQLSFLMYLY